MNLMVATARTTGATLRSATVVNVSLASVSTGGPLHQSFRWTDHDSVFPADPMSGPGASASSNPYNPQKKKSNRKKWIIGGVVLAAIVILGAVLGGVLGSRAGGSDDNGSSSGSNSGGSNQGGNNNGAAEPSSGGNAGTGNGGQTGANGQAYLAISTDANSLPVYPTAVSRKPGRRTNPRTRTLADAVFFENDRPPLRAMLPLPPSRRLLPLGLLTLNPRAPRLLDPTPDSWLPLTSGRPCDRV